MFQCRPSMVGTGLLANRATELTPSSLGPTWPSITRPLDAPRSTAATTPALLTRARRCRPCPGRTRMRCGRWVWWPWWSGAPAGLGAADAGVRGLFLVAGVRECSHLVGRQPAGLAPGGEVGADVGVERVHEDAVGSQDVPGVLGLGQGGGDHEQGAGGHLLDVQDRADLAGDLLLDVVALVEHECDRAGGSVAAAADDLVEDAEELERVGGTHDEVVVGIEAGVEVEGPQLSQAQQLGVDELDVGARRVVADRKSTRLNSS